jgi:hypothetical protein
MTADEWLAIEDVSDLLRHIGTIKTGRKLRLFACACCRQIWRYIPDGTAQNAVEVSERYADGNATFRELQVAQRKARAVASELASDAQLLMKLSKYAAKDAAEAAAECAQKRVGVHLVAVKARDAINATPERPRDYVALLRDIFGNPFRPATFDAAWRTDTAVSIARGMYESRDFGAMPILADALQDAGCDNEDVLNHCRDAKQVHVRGCWVVDLVLGKV